MKKVLIALMIVMVMVPVIGLVEGAEIVEEATEMISWGEILTQAVIGLVGLIGLAGSVFVGKYLYPLMRDTVIPWLEDKNLIFFAEAAVKYAEAALGRFNGAEKWEAALDWLAERGWNVDSDAVRGAVQAAWYSLNLGQILAGIKKPEEVEPGNS